MLTSLSFIFLLGLAMAAVCQKVRLPRIIGMLVTGILLGPYVLGLLDDKILSVSADLRQMALIIILLKAGLSLDLADLKKVGRPAILMSFLPASMEILAFILFSPTLFHFSFAEAALMGSVLAAVSPAVVVPRMVHLIEQKYGTQKSIPQLIMAGASCDDVFIIVLFSTFMTMVQGGEMKLTNLIQIPVSILSGIAFGILVGYGLAMFFEKAYQRKHYVRNSTKVIVILGISFMLVSLETWCSPWLPFSGLLAVTAMAATLKMKSTVFVSKRLSEKFGKLWIAAEVILFVLVGAAVDLRYTLTAGPVALVMIFVALIFRAAGVLLCLIKTPIQGKERWFCVTAYMPKATVQAAIGGVALGMGLACGQMILSVAVIAILITAPVGAIGIDCTYQHWLTQEKNDCQ